MWFDMNKTVLAITHFIRDLRICVYVCPHLAGLKEAGLNWKKKMIHTFVHQLDFRIFFKF